MEKIDAPHQRFNRSQCIYTECYCEQNVYQICKKFQETKRQQQEGYAILLTNPKQSTFIRYAKKSKDYSNQYLIRWDYHVIFILIGKDKKAYVYDHDSMLNWGQHFNIYFEKSLKTKKYQQKTLFRVISTDLYLKYFASDRSHMIIQKSKNKIRYSMPVPCYNAIKNIQNQQMTLYHYLDCKQQDQKYGFVLNQSQFLNYFNQMQIIAQS